MAPATKHIGYAKEIKTECRRKFEEAVMDNDSLWRNDVMDVKIYMNLEAYPDWKGTGPQQQWRAVEGFHIDMGRLPSDSLFTYLVKVRNVSRLPLRLKAECRGLPLCWLVYPPLPTLQPGLTTTIRIYAETTIPGEWVGTVMLHALPVEGTLHAGLTASPAPLAIPVYMRSLIPKGLSVSSSSSLMLAPRVSSPWDVLSPGSTSEDLLRRPSSGSLKEMRNAGKSQSLRRASARPGSASSSWNMSYSGLMI